MSHSLVYISPEVLDNRHSSQETKASDANNNRVPPGELTIEELCKELKTTDQRLTREYTHLKEELQPVIRLSRDFQTLLTTLVQTSTFVAGVQAGTISWTMNANESSYRVASNWFGFCGLVLDIAGGIFGGYRLVYHYMTTSVLERCLERAKKHEELFKQFSANLETSLKEAEQSKTPMEDIRHAKDDMQAYVTSYMTVLEDVKSDKLLYFIVSSGAIRFKAPKAPAATNTTAEEIHETVMGRKMRPHFYVMLSREIVALAMVLGMIFLLISVIMETQVSQRKQVWLACICFAGVTAVYALAPMIVAQSRRVYLPRRGGEGRSSENSLDV